MKKLLSLLLVLSSLLILSCASSFKDIKIQAETNPKVDWSKYKTYVWGGSAKLIMDPENRWVSPKVDVNAELRFLINQELRKRGFTEVRVDGDFSVTTAIGVKMDAMTIKEDPDSKMELLQNIPQSALTIIMIDGKTREPVWIGLATGEALAKGDANLAKKRLDYAVSEIFDEFPK